MEKKVLVIGAVEVGDQPTGVLVGCGGRVCVSCGVRGDPALATVERAVLVYELAGLMVNRCVVLHE